MSHCVDELFTERPWSVMDVVILLTRQHPSAPQNNDLEKPVATARTCARCAAAAAKVPARRCVYTGPATE